MSNKSRQEALNLALDWVCEVGRRDGDCGRRPIQKQFPSISKRNAQWLAEVARAAGYDPFGVDSKAPDPTDTDGRESVRYEYNERDDEYTIRLRTYGEETFSGEAVRSMRAAYSTTAGNPTMREVAHRFGLTRNRFDEIRAAMGWTKRDLPFTDEDLSSKDEETLVTDGLALKAARVEAALERKSHTLDRQDAEKWRRVWFSFGDAIRQEVAVPAPVQRLSLSGAGRRSVLVLGLNDFHFGSYGSVLETGESFNRDEAVRRLYGATAFLIERLGDTPVEIILPVSGDMVHIDTAGSTTTKGTPMDTDGTATEIALTWLRVLRTYVDMVRQMAPVRCIPLHGNHDLIVSTVVLAALAEIYRDCPDVSVESHGRRRHYVEWEGNLLAFAHGDGVKYKDLPGVVAAESAAAWGRCQSRHIWTGHLHHERVLERPGCKTYIMPSLSGPDRFHEKGGYISDAGLMAYVVEAGGLGVTQQLFAPVR